MTFNEMIELLRRQTSRKFRRVGWADLAVGDGTKRGSMWIEMRMDEEHRPYAILMLAYPERTIQAPRWTATLTDKAATDWEEVRDGAQDDVPVVQQAQ